MNGTQSRFDPAVLDPAQSRLRLRRDLLVSPRNSSLGPAWVIEDPIRGKFFELGTAEHRLLSKLDGSATIAEAVAGLSSAATEDALSEAEAVAVCRWALEHQLAACQDPVARQGTFTGLGTNKGRPPFNPLAIQLPVFNPDPLLRTLAPIFGWLWTRWGVLLWVLTGGWSVCKVCEHSSDWFATPAYLFDPQNYVRIGVVWVLLKVAHELAHGLASRSFCVPVRRAGAILLFLAPAAFVDVTAAWRLSSRWQRIVISVAGMYVETLIAFLAILVWTPGSMDAANRLCLEVALLAGVHTILFNANPLMRMDGYFILADWLGIPNLSRQGQRLLSDIARHWLGGADVPLDDVRGPRNLLVLGYGLCSAAWRILVFGSISFALIAKWGWPGALAASLFGPYWFGLLPRPRKAKRAQSALSPGAQRRRRNTVASLAVVAAILMAWLLSPAYVTAPAMVEYGPLTVLRAEASGHVSSVFVTCGQTVEADTVLVEITSDELKSQLNTVEVELQQARLRCWAFLRKSKLPHQQSEQALIESLETKQRELRKQAELLVVRAPRRATVVSREINTLAGRYVRRGDIVLMLGGESEKELIVSIDATDEADFLKQVGAQVSFKCHGAFMDRHAGRLANVEPKALAELTAPALGANVGGDVIVKLVNLDEDAGTNTNYHSLQPRFVATVSLDRDTSRGLRAGRRVIVLLSGSSQMVIERLYAKCSRFIQQLSETERLLTYGPDAVLPKMVK